MPIIDTNKPERLSSEILSYLIILLISTNQNTELGWDQNLIPRQVRGMTKRRVKNRRIIWDSYDFGKLSLSYDNFCRPKSLTLPLSSWRKHERVKVYLFFSRQISKSNERVTFFVTLPVQEQSRES